MLAGVDRALGRMVCAICDGVIKGPYRRNDFLHEVVCQSCLSAHDTCSLCSRPAPEFEYRPGGMVVCRLCLKHESSCARCEASIDRNSARIVPGLPGMYCQSCIAIDRRCSTCKIPLGMGDPMTQDAHLGILCQRCTESHILSEETANNVVVNIAHLLHRLAGMPIPASIDVTLRHPSSLMSTGHSNALGGFQRENGKPVIVFPHGIRLEKGVSLGAKAYAQYWQEFNNLVELPQMIASGFASWTTMTILTLLGYDREKRDFHAHMNGSGVGYARLAGIEAYRGKSGVLDYMTRRHLYV